MTSTTKFVDANIFINRWSKPPARALIDDLSQETHCTSVLVLSEVYHKLKKRNVERVFDYIRTIMSRIVIYDITKNDFFNAAKNDCNMQMNDKLHIEVMKRNGVNTIISYDKDFDSDKTIIREEP